MSETKLIYTAIPAIIAEVGPVGKTTKNTQQGYMYRSADDICDALHDALGKHGVFATCKIEDLQRGERASKSGGGLQLATLKAVYTFHAKDGSSVSTEAIGEGMDSGDKVMNKAMTAAYKYALIQVFAMMGHEDSERDSPEPQPQGTRTAKADHAKKLADEHGMKTADQLPALTDAEQAYVIDVTKEIAAEAAREDKQVAEANLEAIAAFLRDKSEPVRKAVGPLWLKTMKVVNPNWKMKKEPAE